MQADVAIIGCGPTGALLGNLLGARGLSVAIFEKQPAIYDLPRAVHFDGETMRVFQSAGLAEAVLPETRVNPGMLFKDPAGRTLIDWSRDMSIGPMGWPESYRFHQPGLERVLRAGLARYPNVRLHESTAVTAHRQDDTGVTLTTDKGTYGAAHVVACDGTGSPTREALGIGLHDLGFHERWLVVDLRLTRDRPDLGDHSIQFCDPERPATYVRCVGPRRRWEMRIDSGDPDHFAPDEIWRRLSRWITPADADLERAAVYTFRSRLAARWREGRVFLAGDAAHQTPPFMGQGMCAGIRDAANLAWKLAAVHHGVDPAILDTYESERAPNARAFIQLAADMGQLINQTVQGHLPQGRMRSIWPDLGPGLGPRDGIGGALAPQVGRADDAAPTGFHLLTRAPFDADLPAAQGAEDWLAERDLFGVILRPDGYALDHAATPEGLHEALARHADLLDAVPPRRL
ncbi:bifunctional 3-(3-hydroxy-phenyl)propionate/3-hydroxycinnamic acid hydroxylase [Psychromarinibacter sp. C21-152]|uniref:Bifunctional 3-(3-hydroxy-phenyl)propionate/3-hydroxycinnamic acid hydroxylase n=1 Tax=Psychromarinibacter sediminicola TaxID=3033385 RepID=A0AAE3TA31_9RHOB|nr:bifunctional 3-(3-hydroxy-phenyl)propionate/3-hydroxycinnamic acid hydroxylase [Psychromarinibacter sediminicola]MDF0601584.1 bifunctional 3-(3-hydroxy-phenyl)propionate/3-hydroxycinnamic acid hydroxylase [Psychromarinibacter sediminicola]